MTGTQLKLGLGILAPTPVNLQNKVQQRPTKRTVLCCRPFFPADRPPSNRVPRARTHPPLERCSKRQELHGAVLAVAPRKGRSVLVPRPAHCGWERTMRRKRSRSNSNTVVLALLIGWGWQTIAWLKVSSHYDPAT